MRVGCGKRNEGIKVGILLISLLISIVFIVVKMSLFCSGSKKSGEAAAVLHEIPTEEIEITSTPEEGQEKTDRTLDAINSFKGLNMNKEDVSISFEGNKLNLKLPIYNDNNRLYIPVTEIVYNTGGQTTINSSDLEINFGQGSAKIDLINNYIVVGEKKFPLRKKAVIQDNLLFLNLFDFVKMFNLKTDWNIETKVVSLYNNKEEIQGKDAKPTGKAALIRLEDICINERYSRAEDLEKLRIISDYMYSKGIPFHVAWVPRYLNPPKGIDNDPADKLSLYNSDFIFTLDYFLDRKGIIGLHGYTHQHGREVSVEGYEFSSTVNADEKSTRTRVEMAVSAGKKLDIPYKFFESPHYAATIHQKEIFSDYVDYIYEGLNSWHENKVSKKRNKDREIRYIPTMLNYVDGEKDVNNMINKIKSLKGDELASFFYHPNIEFSSIQIQRDSKGYPSYTYASNSVLHVLINTFEERGYTFEAITDLD